MTDFYSSMNCSVAMKQFLKEVLKQSIAFRYGQKQNIGFGES